MPSTLALRPDHSTPRLDTQRWNRARVTGGHRPELCAAQYLRMSTDHQECSITVQREAIARYAEAQGLQVVRTYADEGKSGLTAEGRSGLCALLDDVSSGRADYAVVLVYDISRWGRFQDCDESAFYEQVCRRAGVRVEYCTEPFRNDGSALTAVMKSLKRVMAGEYSRELSKRTFAAKCVLVRRGFRMGGTAGFGLRRLLITQDGVVRGTLAAGEHKFLQTDRVIQIPGPPEEVRWVRWIFEQIVSGRTTTDVARDLNAEGVPFPSGRPWNRDRVLCLVTNEKYAGNLVYNKTSMKLKTRTVRNPGSEWVRKDGAFEAVVEPELFRRAQDAIARWTTRISNDAALDKLRALLAKHGRLSERLIAAEPGMPKPHFYDYRFKGLHNAYRLAGWASARDDAWVAGHGERRLRAERLRQAVTEMLRSRGVRVSRSGTTTLVLRGRCRLAVFTARCDRSKGGARWLVQPNFKPRPQWALIERLNEVGDGALDYCLAAVTANAIALGAKPRKRHVRSFASQPAPLVEELLRRTAAPGEPKSSDNGGSHERDRPRTSVRTPTRRRAARPAAGPRRGR